MAPRPPQPSVIDLLKPYDPDTCEVCGRCFSNCPVMALPQHEARAEMTRLRAKQPTQKVLNNCTTCFACVQGCPSHNNPTRLVLDTWNEKVRQDGLPARAEYFLPDSRPNFRTYVVDRLPADEKALVDQWADDTCCEEVMFPGCNWITAPFLAQTKLLEGIEIRGRLDLCCGETLFRTGLFDTARAQAEKVLEYYSKLGVKRLIIPCTAGLNMFTKVFPQVFGLHPPFEVRHLLYWLEERLASGAIQPQHPLNLTATLQDSCYGRFFGEAFMDLPRKILSRLGVRVVEEELCRDRALCCGIGGGFSPASGYHPWDITRSAFRSLQLAQHTGAEAVAVYCAGCLQMLSLAQLVSPVGRAPVYHLMELLQMSIDEVPVHRTRSRAWMTFKGVLRYQVPKLLTRRRIFPEPPAA